MKRALVKIFTIILFAQIFSASSRNESGQIVFNDFPENSLHNIKRTFLGKRKRGYSQYKGWILLSWSEENNARKKYNEGKIDGSEKKYNDK